MTEEPKLSASPILSGDDVSNDAMQLILVSVFNGFCRVIRVLAHNGLLDADQIENIHYARRPLLMIQTFGMTRWLRSLVVSWRRFFRRRCGMFGTAEDNSSFGCPV